jgi:hypothetical protein
MEIASVGPERENLFACGVSCCQNIVYAKTMNGQAPHSDRKSARFREGTTDFRGLVIAHDSSAQAQMMEDYVQALGKNRDLETVLVDASRWGVGITRKMR